MSEPTLLINPGFDPVQVVRSAYTLGVSQVVLPVTKETEYVSAALRDALEEIGLDCGISALVVDEVSPSSVLSALRPALAEVLEANAELHVVVGGRPKPVSAACAVISAERGATEWALDERRRALHSGSEVVPFAEPTVNLRVETVGRLYAVHSTRQIPALADTETLLRWLRHALGPSGARVEPQEAGATFEQAVVALLREQLPPEYEVWGPTVCILRDPENPDAEALDEDDEPRTFEVDGVVIRGTRVWVVESKFIGAKFGQLAALTAYAELDRRRQHLGGPTAGGVLVMKNEDRARTMVEGPYDAFQPAGVEVLGGDDLLEALKGESAELRAAFR